MNRLNQSGQGMVSFLVASVFLFIPLSLGINYLAKLGDARHKTHEAARYSAWERTVWSPSDTDYNIKTADEINNEILSRIFGHALLPINSINDKAVMTDKPELDPNLTLWPRKGQRSSVLEAFDDSTYSSLDIANQSASGSLSSAINQVASKFDLNKRGLYEARVAFRFSKNSNIRTELMMESTSPFIEVTATAALLTDAWNATTSNMVANRVRGTLLTDSLNNSALDTLKTAIAPFHPEIEDFEPGFLQPDMLPCQRLVITGKEESCI
jgi:hypothetical protein